MTKSAKHTTKNKPASTNTTNRANGGIMLNKKQWIDDCVKSLEYPYGQKHWAFFKSADKKYAFAMTDIRHVYEIVTTKDKKAPFKLVQVLCLFLALLCVGQGAYASVDNGVFDHERLATAIYHAEGGAKTAHTYGILPKYKHTTPRQACLNTIASKLKAWKAQGSKGSYLTYLASKYAPVGSDTDNGTNRFWEKNVRALYLKH